jgi:hypothetical protein
VTDCADVHRELAKVGNTTALLSRSIPAERLRYLMNLLGLHEVRVQAPIENISPPKRVSPVRSILMLFRKTELYSTSTREWSSGQDVSIPPSRGEFYEDSGEGLGSNPGSSQACMFLPPVEWGPCKERRMKYGSR